MKRQANQNLDLVLINSSMTITISIEGNVGAGKSTFLSSFSDVGEEIDLLLEPVEQWQNLEGHNLLKLMYEDPKQNTFLFQMYVMLTDLMRHLKPSTKRARLVERYSGSLIFIAASQIKGDISPEQTAVLDAWRSAMSVIPGFQMRPDAIIYLKTSPRVAFQRIKERNRDEERGVKLEFIEELHMLHEIFFSEISDLNSEKPIKVFTVDADEPLGSAEFDRVKGEVMEYIRTKSSLNN